MRRGRQRYYDLFSKWYDRFIALHATGESGRLKAQVAEAAALAPGQRVLDICTGTGTLLPALHRASAGGLAVGVDFSRGMLSVARGKTGGHPGICLIQADVSRLPFRSGRFDAVTCTHAFYEIRGDDQTRCLKEVVRILKPGRPFLMVEHEIPKHPLIRFLFYIRIFSMGTARAVQILRHESGFLRRFFSSVQRIQTASGRSKLLICRSRGAHEAATEDQVMR